MLSCMPAATVIVPLPFIVILPGNGDVPAVKVILAGFTTAWFNESFVNTLSCAAYDSIVRSVVIVYGIYVRCSYCYRRYCVVTVCLGLSSHR